MRSSNSFHQRATYPKSLSDRCLISTLKLTNLNEIGSLITVGPRWSASVPNLLQRMRERRTVMGSSGWASLAMFLRLCSKLCAALSTSCHSLRAYLARTILSTAAADSGCWGGVIRILHLRHCSSWLADRRHQHSTLTALYFWPGAVLSPSFTYDNQSDISPPHTVQKGRWSHL